VRWLDGQLSLDERGYIVTGTEARNGARHGRPPLLLGTSRPGVFAAGDVRIGSIKRVASDCASGQLVDGPAAGPAEPAQVASARRSAKLFGHERGHVLRGSMQSSR
jgi:thioredoxin reductase